MALNKDEEIPEVQFGERALSCLRKIRGSAFEWVARPHPLIETRTAITDAEQVGTIAASYIIDSIGGQRSQETERRLSDSLTGFEEKYAEYRESLVSPEWSRIKLRFGLPSHLDSFRLLAKAPNPNEHDSLWKHAIGTDNLKQMSDLGIFNNRLGVISPLSSDYFQAVLLQRFIQQHIKAPCFKLKPLVLSPALDCDSEAGDGQRDNKFAQDVDELAIWTNLDVSFRTRIGASRAANLLYPEIRKRGIVLTA